LNTAIIRNVAVNISVQILTAIAGFILPPLIIAAYGSTQNGMVVSISQFIAYLTVMGSGISAASIAALVKPIYDNDKNKINSILAATQNFYSKSGLIFTFMILLLIFVYPFIIAGEDIDKPTAGLMVLVISFNGIIDFFVIGKYRALLVADRKYFIMGIFKIIALIINTTVSIILIENGNSLLFVKFISVFIFVLNNILVLIYVRKTYPFINLKTKFEKNTLEQRWDVMYHHFCGMVVANSPLILLTVLCSLKEVSIYSIYALIFFAVGQLIDTFFDGMQGFFGRFIAENNPEKLKKIYGKYETVYFSLIGIGYTCALIFTIPFMRIYTVNMTDANYIQPTLAALFAIVGVMSKIRNPSDMFVVSAGHFKQTKWRSVAEAVINIFASIFFVIKLGFTGVLLGAVCSFSYRTLDMIIYSSRHIVHNSLSATFAKIIVFGIWYCAGYFILSNFVISDIKNYFDFAKNALVSIVFLSVPILGYLFFVKFKL